MSPLSRDGFSLPAVLLLLIVAGLLAVSSTALTTNQVRMAGELRSSVMSINAAEAGAAFLVNGFASQELEWLPDGEYLGPDLLGVGDDLPVEEPETRNHGSTGPAAWWVESMEFSGDDVIMRIHGIVLGTATQRTLEVTFERGESSSDSPFSAAVVGCEGVDLAGSGRIDSWDSSLGAYSAALSNTNANVGTLDPSGDVVINGNSPLLGDVRASRDIRVNGSAQVAGDYVAFRNIIFNGNPNCPNAEVRAGGAISTPGAWWVNGCGGTSDWEEGANVSLPQEPCDPLNAQDLVADSMAHYRPMPSEFSNWTHSGWRPNPLTLDSDRGVSGNFRIGPGAHPVVVDAVGLDVLFVDGNFDLTSDARLHFRNSSAMGSPQHIRLFIDGNLSTTGASRWEIDPGVAVDVYVTGTINFAGGHSQSIPATVEVGGEIRPTLAMYTSFSGNNGVRVSGDAPLSTTIYAPYTSVSVSGSGRLYGAVRGRTVTVSGAAGIHYDEALGLVGGGSGVTTGDARITVWREVR